MSKEEPFQRGDVLEGAHGSYRVLEEIGSGGQGIVYRCVSGDQAYALKAPWYVSSGYGWEKHCRRVREELSVMESLEASVFIVSPGIDQPGILARQVPGDAGSVGGGHG